ncbi:UDP-3-O-(3-hydroxymyristoyl)glucosamine N-acyltransferase [Edaphobacter albus]|uniref:UDP-3-O-(3-hydroxymyristoyl)glucosamine N-acyltransferase n=1 Tax=Edaphobacter sp. 4G125 TaxID=2763071 RepID=UPI0016440EB9|nr:UDP-3-O-(3-hydroxymyristoyl)glucosamine N-acyltransferase [Edaphobacter sp. 4G125]QNI36082.1 UDP-3-O-(3-hydroxymyristoyl)glucosamine N-acyltransferase [Edaphobacter sp. 4G125]
MAKAVEVAAWVGCLESDLPATDAEILRVSGVEDAGRDAVVFAVDQEALKFALASKAGLILANTKLKSPDAEVEDGRIVWVEDARYSFSVVASRLAKRIGAGVHPTAIVGQDVAIGQETSIGPGVVLGDGVRIGQGCRIDARVTIYPGVVIGDEVTVQAGAVLGGAGFGYARSPETGEYVLFPQQGRLVIEDTVEIGANTTIDRGALGETRIGYGTKIDNLVHIGHNCVIGRNVVIAAQTGISGSSVVEDGAILGGQVGIGEHATVGEGVILGGGAGVLSGKKMHGKGEVFWGRPARPLKEYLRDLARLKRGGGERS